MCRRLVLRLLGSGCYGVSILNATAVGVYRFALADYAILLGDIYIYTDKCV